MHSSQLVSESPSAPKQIKVISANFFTVFYPHVYNQPLNVHSHVLVSLRERERERERDRQTDRGGERDRERNREKHVTQDINIVVDRGIQPHPHPNPHTQVSRLLVFPLFHSDGQTDQQTDGWTDRQSLS